MASILEVPKTQESPDLSGIRSPQPLLPPRLPKRDRHPRPLFLGPDGGDASTLQLLWDDIELGPMEGDVIAALQLIHPDIQRLSFKGQGAGSAAFVKLKDAETGIPMGSLGDGIRPILTLAMFLTVARGGMG